MTSKSEFLAAVKQQPASTVATAPHVIVKALAGTGKTTTLVNGISVVLGKEPSIEPSEQQAAVWESMALSSGARSICFSAFNKAIAAELQRRVPQGAVAMTNHSLGFAAVKRSFDKVKVNNWRVREIIADILHVDPRDLRGKDFDMVRATESLVGLCKCNLVDPSPEELDVLTSYYEVETNGNRDRIYSLVPQVIDRCKDVKHDNEIDFDDMIWLPVVLDLPAIRYDLLLVDEAQDLNRCQQALARKSGSRLILCGDAHQAIYGFAGADCESMDRMYTELSETPEGCIELPLTVTRRCGRAIVEEARRYVPEFEAHDSNPDGLVSEAIYESKSDDTYSKLIQAGDMALCRVNAPLIIQCLRMLKAGRRAEIQGRDIGQGLITLIKKMKADDVPSLVQKLSDWLFAETQKENRKRHPSDNRLIAIQDKHDCIICFSEGCSSVYELIGKIEALFTDDTSQTEAIKFSTIHKAKGLEANRVFFLEPEGATCPHPMAKSDWQRKQEFNLRYVAITRAISELVYVS